MAFRELSNTFCLWLDDLKYIIFIFFVILPSNAIPFCVEQLSIADPKIQLRAQADCIFETNLP